MAGRGGGPSRRSHTKSRKGCKTCKRRHIRCDETFPQCRNCSKHQVRCDYHDLPPLMDDSLRINTQPNLRWTSDIERAVDAWRQTDAFPFPDLELYSPPMVKNIPRVEVRLLYHVCSILAELRRSRTSKLAMWTEMMQKCLSVCSLHPFVLHAIVAFGASHIAWQTSSGETKTLATEYTAMATRGLQEAMSAPLSKSNGDGILAASILLSWLQNDWQIWNNTMQNLKFVIDAMQRFRPDTIFEEYLAQAPIDPAQKFTSEGSFPPSSLTRQEILGQVDGWLRRLLSTVSLPQDDTKSVEHVRSLIESIRGTLSPQTPKEQFAQLYPLRKLLFWLPVDLLSSRRGDIHTLLLLSYFYSAAAHIETIFPDIGAPFLSSLAAPPLSDIINIIQACQQQQAYDILNQTAAELMDVPKDTLHRYRQRREWARTQFVVQPQYFPDSLGIDLVAQMAEQSAHTPSLSPAFAPSTVHLAAQQPRSPFLDVPGSAVDSPYSPYKPYTPTSGSFQSTPTSQFATSPLVSPGLKLESDPAYQLPVPDYQVSSRSSIDYAAMSMPPMGQYQLASSSGAGYSSARSSLAGGAGPSSALLQSPFQQHGHPGAGPAS